MCKTKTRQDWIDVLRAFAMAFVIYAHLAPNWTDLFVFLSPITIPMFFALTGYVSNYSHKSIIFFKNMLRRIVIPWLIISIITELISYIINGWSIDAITHDILEYLWKLLSGQEIWYIPCYIIATTLFFFLHKTYKKNEWFLIIISLLLFSIGLGLSFLGFDDVFVICQALCVQPFLCLGKIFKTYVENNVFIVRHKKIILVIGIATYFIAGILSIVFYPGQCLDVHLDRYYNIALCGIMIIIGIYTLFSLSKLLKKQPKAFVIVGRNTFVIYLLESKVRALATTLLTYINVKLNKLSAVFVLVFVLTVGTLISICLKKCFPYLMGIHREKANHKM